MWVIFYLICDHRQSWCFERTRQKRQFIQYILTSVKGEARGNAHLSFPKHSSTQTSIPKIDWLANKFCSLFDWFMIFWQRPRFDQHRSFQNSIFNFKEGRHCCYLEFNSTGCSCPSNERVGVEKSSSYQNPPTISQYTHPSVTVWLLLWKL